MTAVRTFDDLSFRLLDTTSLSTEDLALVTGLFAQAYREANVAYLEKSLGRLRHLALAFDASGELVGFALGEGRQIDLPRLPAQNVRLAGLCCIAQSQRRRGLFGALENMALGANQLPPQERTLATGRMAHPASFRGMTRNPTVVPRRGLRPTAWQQEVGIAIAEAYGVPAFDPLTFVCRGTGTPIGYPIIDIESEPEEWELFQPVDRSRGDSLLGMAWGPTAPPGWC